MEHVLYWLWLASRLKGANMKILALTELFGGVENVYLSKSFDSIRGITDKEKSRLLDKDLSAANKIFEKVSKIGGRIIVFDDESYPRILKQTHNPPSVLYVAGRMPDFDEALTIGIVGTRNVSDYGIVVTQRLSADLAKAGVVTVSGMAAGVDAVGAWAAVKEGGIAVGVIGSGIDIAYPRENAELYQAITEKGCIITEFPPGAAPLKRHFPMRNRVIAGLSRGVLVTEAPAKSGSLITARIAVDEGRDVFAVPGDITNINYRGTNKIIQQGAKLVMSADDILCDYPYAKKLEPQKPKRNIVKISDAAAEKENPASDGSSKFKNLSEKERAVAELLIKGDMQIDEIARELNTPVGEMNTRLVMLEMKGIVAKLPGSMYRLKI